MRNGTKLLMLAVMALACTACLMASGANAASLGPTDSGAQAAQVMFPVSNQPNPTAAGMKPVVFNHLIHEKAVEDCTTCHHTGDPQSCTTCHTVEGSANGNCVTLERAMHATNIAKRAENTPQSCVSCHEQQFARRECAGCHSIVKAERGNDWCAVCHNVSPTPKQMQDGCAGKMSAEENLKLAEATIAAHQPAQPISPMSGPLKLHIGALADKYQPNLFTHRRHVASLWDAIKDDKLAQAFHSKPETLCAACHHRSPLSATPPKCGSCHSTTLDPANPQRPTLKAAYHLQCMGCHEGMKVERPRKTDCATCHKPAQ